VKAAPTIAIDATVRSALPVLVSRKVRAG